MKIDDGFIQCPECLEIFLIDEPFCPYCGKPTEEILEEQKDG